MPTVVKMPKWGLTMTAGTVTGWIANEGDQITAGAPLLTVETEKAVNDVEAPADGILRKIVAETGAEVPVSGPVAVILAEDETLTDEEVTALLAVAAPVLSGSVAAADGGRPARPARAATTDGSGRINASPAARRRAEELGLDLAKIDATGPGGRLTSDDVERARAEAKRAAAAPVQEMVKLADGRTLAALMAGPPTAAPAMVFLHGLGGSQGAWSTALGELADRYRVVAIDLPGHGASDKADPATTDYSIAGLAAPIAEAIESLGVAPALLIGHSLGGAVALHLALERPKLVAGLILVDSAGLGEEINAELLDRVESEPSREEAKKWLDLFFEDKRLVLDRGIQEMYQSRLVSGADAALKAVTLASFRREGQVIGLRDRLEEVDRPTLIVWGDQDRVIPVEHGAVAAERIPGAWLDVMEGIGHVPQLEATRAFTQLLDEFARSLPSA